ncbi:alpha/beta hydrolase, partial [bacterium]|nr:alpha/beta hydrolase [bacterium]
GRVVMLSPPNQGSEVIDKLGSAPGFFWFNGPAGQQLGTGMDSIPLKLGKVDFKLGVITGNKSINLILSLLIPGDDDGKVSIENAKVAGMSDFLVLPHSHPFIMNSDDVIHQTKYFLKYGSFKR